MEVESTADLIRCPSCHEEVPTTLYCLNCGYPIYKVEFERPEEEASEEALEEAEEIEEAQVEVEGEVEAPPAAAEEEVPLEEAEEAEKIEEVRAVEVVEAFKPPLPLEEVMREVAKNLSIRMRMVKMLLEGS